MVSNSLLGLKIDKKDIIVLDMIKEQLKYNNDINKKEFIEIVDKLKAVVNIKEDTNDYMDYFTIQPKSNLDYEKHKNFCSYIHFSYITKRKMNITYRFS